MLESLLKPLTDILEDPDITEVYTVGDRLRAVRNGSRYWLDQGLDGSLLELVRRALASSRNTDLSAMQTGHWVSANGQSYRWACGGPPASDTPYLSLRRHLTCALSLSSYVDSGRSPAGIMQSIAEPQSLLIAGTTGSGKTTILSAILNSPGWIDHRVVIVEDTAELVAPADSQRIVTTDMRAGVAHALRLLPDIIVLGEVRGPAAFDAIMAALTGHAACVTVHADNARMARRRMQQLAEQTGCSMAIELVEEAFPHVLVLARGGRISAFSKVDGDVGSED